MKGRGDWSGPAKRGRENRRWRSREDWLDWSDWSRDWSIGRIGQKGKTLGMTKFPPARPKLTRRCRDSQSQSTLNSAVGAPAGTETTLHCIQVYVGVRARNPKEELSVEFCRGS